MMRAKIKGRVKGAGWLMKQVATIYADYLVQEKYMSRDGEPGQFDNFNHFVYKWHMSQFGLKQIAEMNLIDLIATVRANAEKHYQLQVRLCMLIACTFTCRLGQAQSPQLLDCCVSKHMSDVRNYEEVGPDCPILFNITCKHLKLCRCSAV